EENAAPREDDGADAHPRIVGVLAAHRLTWGAPIWPSSLFKRRGPRPPRNPGCLTSPLGMRGRGQEAVAPITFADQRLHAHRLVGGEPARIDRKPLLLPE